MPTRAALGEFDAGKAAFDKIREAFYQDTKHINSHDNCMRVDLEFMRRMTKEGGQWACLQWLHD